MIYNSRITGDHVVGVGQPFTGQLGTHHIPPEKLTLTLQAPAPQLASTELSLRHKNGDENEVGTEPTCPQ